jgi:hypothetical protein
MISALHSELEHIDDSIRSMERPDRRSTRTARAAPRSVIKIRSIAKANTTTISERNQIEMATAFLERSDRLTDPPAGRVVEIRSARKPGDGFVAPLEPPSPR